ncbi:hypothetical protein HAX54_002198 [Datura stramonium]|uniref:Uncharacterized protein n=1 Tax=Datura stramonium TaxID=4076 RepID=A0ABS8RSW4_DATST|nr:hypothetical protein [Datura stramonium]
MIKGNDNKGHQGTQILSNGKVVEVVEKWNRTKESRMFSMEKNPEKFTNGVAINALTSKNTIQTNNIFDVLAEEARKEGVDAVVNGAFSKESIAQSVNPQKWRDRVDNDDEENLEECKIQQVVTKEDNEGNLGIYERLIGDSKKNK